jgi:hypothetical protein
MAVKMRKPRGQIETLPGDGWIRLAPGATLALHEDTSLSPSLVDLRKWMNDIRGGVLSLSFGIENELILLALADEFGSNDHGAVGSDYFLREQEWREDHSLERKIGLEPENKEGVTRLEDQRTIALTLFIADRQHVWEIDPPQREKTILRILCSRAFSHRLDPDRTWARALPSNAGSPEFRGVLSLIHTVILQEHDLAKVGVEGSNPFARSKT